MLCKLKLVLNEKVDVRRNFASQGPTLNTNFSREISGNLILFINKFQFLSFFLVRLFFFVVISISTVTVNPTTINITRMSFTPYQSHPFPILPHSLNTCSNINVDQLNRSPFIRRSLASDRPLIERTFNHLIISCALGSLRISRCPSLTGQKHPPTLYTICKN